MLVKLTIKDDDDDDEEEDDEASLQEIRRQRNGKKVKKTCESCNQVKLQSFIPTSFIKGHDEDPGPEYP